MPLYRSIPLCSFDYTGDTLSSATLKYDTTSQINKSSNNDTKYLEVEQEGLVKESTKLLYDSVVLINKNSTKLMYKNIYNINKLGTKLMYRSISDIIKSNLYSMNKEIFSIYKDNIYSVTNEYLNIIDKEMIKDLQSTFINEFNLLDYKLLLDCDCTQLYKNYSISLNNTTINDLNVSMIKSLFNDISELIKKYDISLLKDTITINKNDSYNLSRIENNITKLKDFILSAERYPGLIKSENLPLDRINLIDLSYSTNKYYEYLNNLIIEKSIPSRYMEHLSLINILKEMDDNYLEHLTEKSTPIGKLSNGLYLGRISTTNIYNGFTPRHLIRYIFKDLWSTQSYQLLERVSKVDIYKSNNLIAMDRVNLTNIQDIFSNLLLEDITINNIFELEYIKSLNRLTNNNIFKIDPYHSLSKEVLIDVFKEQAKYHDYSPLVQVNKQKEKLILNLSMLNLYKENHKSLFDLFIPQIIKDSPHKFIEITKRWWWLNESGPKDNLIVPNKDYDKMTNLLNNPNLEYLRYTNHPIDWGKTWGIDNNIPPYAVSVNVMMDLVNIIIMIWHHDQQTWFNCSGKEAMQFLMELIYDWYNMSTSNPNESYKRAYRWVRWEAEKVYFMDMELGIQAIGTLVGNLLEYMKNHHFNIPAVWRNPKAMDIEKYFKDTLHEYSLVKDINKIKGKRHYLIETQNFEKQDLFRRR
jgi:hypothetical protein